MGIIYAHINKIRDAWTPERRKMMSDKLKAKWQDPEYRQRKIESLRGTTHKGLKGPAHPMYGVHKCGKESHRKIGVICVNTEQ